MIYSFNMTLSTGTSYSLYKLHGNCESITYYMKRDSSYCKLSISQLIKFNVKENKIMIDAKYAMKYPMPHSVVHIVDNSMYTGQLPTVVADDPSLYATIVVTGTPMGEDGKVVKITRSDVASAAYGLGNLTADDVKKYGQSITYPLSIINQGAPVQLLRVTPEGSTYAVTTLVVQWRRDVSVNPGIFHVRIKEFDLPTDFILDRFKNKERLHNAIVKQVPTSVVDSDGTTWNQACFATFIGAGRGAIYNNFNVAVNFVPQNKRPANVKYEWVTIDTRSSSTIERFTASLVNINNQGRTDYIETVNTAVAHRVAGSSVVVPTINEDAVKKVYADYMTFYKEQLAAKTVITTLENNCYATLNVNTFDLLYGNYIYEGSNGSETKLPFYQVDAFDTSIPRLDPQFRKVVQMADPSAYVAKEPNELYEDILNNYTVGIDPVTVKSTIHIGDVYLNATGANNTRPMVSMIAGINQYTGSITSVTVPKVFVLDDNGERVKDTSNNPIPSTPIALIYNDTANGENSLTVKQAVYEGKVVANSVIAWVSGSTFKLYRVTAVTKGTSAANSSYSIGNEYTTAQVRKALDWSSMSTNVGNIIGRTTDDPAFFRPGATVVDTTSGDVYINNFNIDSSDVSIESAHRIENDGTKSVFGSVPTEIVKTDDIIGSYYDVLVYDEDAVVEYKLLAAQPDDWTDHYYTDYYTADGDNYVLVPQVPTWTEDTYFERTGDPGDYTYTLTTSEPANWNTNYTDYFTRTGEDPDFVYTQVPVAPVFQSNTYYERTTSPAGEPSAIYRYLISGVQGSLYRISYDPTIIPYNYYSDEYGINLSTELGGVSLKHGSTGFMDDATINSVEFKWKYSALLVKAFRGEIDPRIMSPTRTPAKYLFDGGTNTVVGQAAQSYVTYDPVDIISASSIFTEDEKDEVLYDKTLIDNIDGGDDVDVKQAMYDFMVERCYQRIPEEKRPVGPGYGLQLNLDAGITDANTALLMNSSFAKKFDNPNAVWDIGGWVDSTTGLSYTYVKRLVDNLFTHIKQTSVNKPFTGSYSNISKDEYISYFPDIDTTDWELRQLMYNSGGNVWIVDVNENLQRRSQRTLYREAETSDLIQESNMRTLSQLCYLVQNEIDGSLLEYDDDGVLKTLEETLRIKFATWVGENVQSLEIYFERDKNIDGGDLLVCYVNVTFRGLILRVPIIVNVQARTTTTTSET